MVREEARRWAERAIAAYGALQKYFYAHDGTGLYRERYPSRAGAYATAWSFGRALVGTLALAGIPAHVLGERRHLSYRFAARERLSALAHYWDESSSPPGFHGRPLAPLARGGDKYYDDNAWLGLELLQHHRMTGNPRSLTRAEAVFAFVYPGGWHKDTTDPYPGGIFWIQQGTGAGLANHDRACVSNAPNAEIAFQLGELLPGKAPQFFAAGAEIHDWVLKNLKDDRAGLFCDMVAGDGKIDATLRTYNQGAVIAANVMRYRTTRQESYLSQAEAIARAALSYFSQSFYVSHSCAFNAIYFRGLLQLHSVSADAALKDTIIQSIQTYAEDAWRNYRSPEHLFSFSRSASQFELLDQGAMLQILATLAWDPGTYPMLG